MATLLKKAIRDGSYFNEDGISLIDERALQAYHSALIVKLDEKYSSIENPLRLVGKGDTLPSTGNDGDIYILGTTEYLYFEGAWDPIGSIEVNVDEVNNAKNVTQSIRGVSLDDIFETETKVVHNARNATNADFASALKSNAGSETQPIYINNEGKPIAINYTIETSVPRNAKFTDTDTKVTSVDNHYTPTTNANSELSVSSTTDEIASHGVTQVLTGITISRDAKGHITNLNYKAITLPSDSGGGTGGDYLPLSGGAISGSLSIDDNLTVSGSADFSGAVDVEGNVTANSFVGDLKGNADTANIARKLQDSGGYNSLEVGYPNSLFKGEQGSNGFAFYTNGDTTTPMLNIGNSSVDTKNINVGSGNTVNGTNRGAIGYECKATATRTFACNNTTTANAEDACAFGNRTEALGEASVVMGNSSKTTENASNSLAVGLRAIAGGANSLSIGTDTGANGNNTLAQGYLSIASGPYSAVFGYQNETSAWGSFAGGSDSFNGGTNSIAFGSNNKIHASATSQESQDTAVFGADNVVGKEDGTSTTERCFVANSKNTAFGQDSAIFGSYNMDLEGNSSCLICGRGNLPVAGARFIIGEATDSSKPETTRANLMYVKADETRIHTPLVIDKKTTIYGNLQLEGGLDLSLTHNTWSTSYVFSNNKIYNCIFRIPSSYSNGGGDFDINITVKPLANMRQLLFTNHASGNSYYLVFNSDYTSKIMSQNANGWDDVSISFSFARIYDWCSI